MRISPRLSDLIFMLDSRLPCTLASSLIQREVRDIQLTLLQAAGIAEMESDGHPDNPEWDISPIIKLRYKRAWKHKTEGDDPRPLPRVIASELDLSEALAAVKRRKKYAKHFTRVIQKYLRADLYTACIFWEMERAGLVVRLDPRGEGLWCQSGPSFFAARLECSLDQPTLKLFHRLAQSQLISRERDSDLSLKQADGSDMICWYLTDRGTRSGLYDYGVPWFEGAMHALGESRENFFRKYRVDQQNGTLHDFGFCYEATSQVRFDRDFLRSDIGLNWMAKCKALVPEPGQRLNFLDQVRKGRDCEKLELLNTLFANFQPLI